MALPNPSANIPQNAPSMNAKDPVVDEIKDVKLTLKEAVTTGLKAGFLTTQTKVFSKIPLFGRGLAERAEFKKREMFEREGRDPLTGRKLTKEELEEKQLRKKSMGAMGDIRDDVAEIRDILIKQFGASAAGAKPSSPPALIVVPSDKTTPYALEGEEPVMDKLSAEEAMQEKQKADREVQEEIQEKEQIFFEKLFKKYFGEGDKGNATAVAASGGGLLSKIAGIVDFAADIKSLGGGSILRGVGRKIPGVRNIPGIRTPTPPPLPTSPPPLPGVKPPLLPTPSAAPSGGGFFSRAFGAVKNIGAKAVGMVGSAGKAVYGATKSAVGSVAKMGLSTVGKTVLGILGPLLTVMLESFNISSIKNDPNLALAEKKRQIGLTIGRMIGSLLGAGVAALGLGPAGPILTSILDGFGIGPGALGEWLTEKIGPEKVYDLTAAIPGIGSLIKVPEDEGKPVNGAEGEMSPEGELQVPTGNAEIVPSPVPISSAAPAIIPSSASTLGNLQTENSMLKSAPTVQPIVAPTNNNVVTTNNNTSWMSPLTTTRTGADFDERSFRLGLAF
jgi:hypothetical protein